MAEQWRELGIQAVRYGHELVRQGYVDAGKTMVARGVEMQREAVVWEAEKKAPSSVNLNVTSLHSVNHLIGNTQSAEKKGPLTNLEFRLYAVLADNLGEVCSRVDLIPAIWGEEHQPSSRDALEQIVKRTRQKIEEEPDRPTHLLTIHGKGYELIDDPLGYLQLREQGQEAILFATDQGTTEMNIPLNNEELPE